MSSKLAAQQLRSLTAPTPVATKGKGKGKAAAPKPRRAEVLKALQKGADSKRALVLKNKQYFQRSTTSKKAAALMERLAARAASKR